MKKIFSSDPQAYPLQTILVLLLIAALFYPAPAGLHAAELYKEDILSDSSLNNPQMLQPFLERTYQSMLDRGITNFYPFSLALIQQCYQAIKEKKYEKALILSEFAQKFSPDLPLTYKARAKAKWAQNKLLLHRLLAGYIQASWKQFGDLESLAFFLTTHALLFLGAFLFTFGLFCAIMLKRYLPLSWHDIAHLIPLEIPRPAFYGWLFFFLLLPLFFNFSIFWVMLYWLLILFNYLTKKEQWVMTGLVCIFACIPFIFKASPVLLAPQADLIHTLWKANFGSWDKSDIIYLKKQSIEHPDDKEILFTLGLIHKKERNYRTARVYYQKVLDLEPDHCKTRINLGNVYFATKQWENAVEEYKKALSLAPAENAVPHYNLSRAYLQNFMFAESEKELLAAKKIDGSRVDYQLKISTDTQNRLMIDEPLTKSDLLKKVFDYGITATPLAKELWDIFFSGVPLLYGFQVVLFCLFLAFISLREKSYRIAVHCRCCNRPVCRRCHRIDSLKITCSQCMKVLGQEQGVDSKIREKKLLAIKRYLQQHQVIGRLLSIVFPGAGHIWKGHPVKGTCLLFVFCSLLLKVIFAFGFIEGPWDFITPPSLLDALPWLALLVLLWPLLSRHSLHLKDEAAEISLHLGAVQKKH